MCGRVNISDQIGVLQLLAVLGISGLPEGWRPRFNLAPGDDLPVVHLGGDRTPQIRLMQWGLRPAWAKDQHKTLINARAETLWGRPSFMKLAHSHRAIIPVNGFYEWQRVAGGKTPYYFYPVQAGAMGLAAIFDIETDGCARCCVVTTSANALMAPIHPRMPAVLTGGGLRHWLEPGAESLSLQPLLRPCPEAFLSRHPVSDYVNRVAHDGPVCIKQAAGRDHGQ